MDRTSTIILVICAILFILWAIMMPKVAREHLERQRAMQEMVSPTNVQTQAPVVSSAPAPANLVTGGVGSAIEATNLPAEEILVVSTRVARYYFTSRGGGLKKIELLEYPQHPVSKKRQDFSPVTLNEGSLAPILGTQFGTAGAYDGQYTLTQIGTQVVAEAVLPQGVKVKKIYQIGEDYLLQGKILIENITTNSLASTTLWCSAGTVSPMADDTTGGPKVTWFNGKKAYNIDAAWFANRILGCFPGTPRSQYFEPSTNLLWVANNNRFFVVALMPEPAPSMLLCTIQNHTVSNKSISSYPVALLYQLPSLQSGGSAEIKFAIYAGPKEYRRLSRIGVEFQNELQRVMGFENVLGGRFTAFFAKLLLVCMNGLHDLLKLGYGWIIIVFTFLIKLIFWPLTVASTRSMKRLQELQPQLNAIREKYKDDPEKMNRKMMEFMKEHRVNPMAGCLPILVQMPVFIGFFIMIQSAIELRGAGFLWIKDLSQPDTLFYIPGTRIPFNLLPLLMGVTMIWQTHLTPQSPGMDRTQQALLRWMPLIFLVLLYNFPSGLTLYWTVQNLLSIAQMKLIGTTQAKTPEPPQKPSPRKR